MDAVYPRNLESFARCFTPEATLRRVEWSVALAGRIGDRVKPMELLDWSLGDLAAPDTRSAVTNAPSVSEAVATLLASPEFQRR